MYEGTRDWANPAYLNKSVIDNENNYSAYDIPIEKGAFVVFNSKIKIGKRKLKQKLKIGKFIVTVNGTELSIW